MTKTIAKMVVLLLLINFGAALYLGFKHEYIKAAFFLQLDQLILVGLIYGNLLVGKYPKT